MRTILIIGLGNILLTDEGIGIHVMNSLKESDEFTDVSFLDLGTSSWELINFIDDQTKLIFIIDCLEARVGKPGDVYALELKDLISGDDYKLSLHQLKLLDSLKMILLEKELPKTIVIGIIPLDTKSISTELSETLKNNFPSIVNKVKDIMVASIENQAIPS